MGKLTLAKAFLMFGHVYVNKHLYVTVQFITKSVTVADALQRGLKCGSIVRGANQYVYTYSFSKRSDIGNFATLMLLESEQLDEHNINLMNALQTYVNAGDRDDRLRAAADVRLLL